MTQNDQTAATARTGLMSRLGDPLVLLLTIGFIIAFVGLSLVGVAPRAAGLQAPTMMAMKAEE